MTFNWPEIQRELEEAEEFNGIKATYLGAVHLNTTWRQRLFSRAEKHAAKLGLWLEFGLNGDGLDLFACKGGEPPCV